MDLEIADFERTVSTLEGRVNDKEDVIASLEQELSHVRQNCATLEQEIGECCWYRDMQQSLLKGKTSGDLVII